MQAGHCPKNTIKHMVALNQTISKWCWLVLVALLGTVAARAQDKVQLKGIVTTESGDALAGVSISVHAEGSKDKQSFSSNEKGLFTLESLVPKTKYRFVFTHVGYEAYEVKAFEIKA